MSPRGLCRGAATVGAAAVAEIAAGLEHAGARGETPDAGDVERLRDVFSRTRDAFAALR
jgi:hypothetical protein